MGERKLRYGDVNVGDTAPAIDHELTRTDLVMYAGASGDFNPMHHDEVAAQAAGLPSVFGHGMFTAGLLATAVTNYVGVGNLTSYRVRFTKQTWPGEVLTHDGHGAREAARQRGRARLLGRQRERRGEDPGRSRRRAPGGLSVAAMRFDLPTPDLETQPFWDGCRRKASSCSGTATRAASDHYYPRPFCPKCWSDDVAWKEAAGAGTLYTYSVVHAERPPAVQRAGAVRRRDRRARRGPARDDQHRGRAVRRAARSACPSSSTSRPISDDDHDPDLPRRAR